MINGSFWANVANEGKLIDQSCGPATPERMLRRDFSDIVGVVGGFETCGCLT